MKTPLHESCLSKLQLNARVKIDTAPPINFLTKNLHLKTGKTSQNTDLDIREILGIGKSLQFRYGELVNNTSKWTRIDKRIKKVTKIKKINEDDFPYFEVQRELDKYIRINK